MSCTGSLPRKWSIRYSRSSGKIAVSFAFSSRAEWRSVPRTASRRGASVPHEPRLELLRDLEEYRRRRRGGRRPASSPRRARRGGDREPIPPRRPLRCSRGARATRVPLVDVVHRRPDRLVRVLDELIARDGRRPTPITAHPSNPCSVSRYSAGSVIFERGRLCPEHDERVGVITHRPEPPTGTMVAERSALGAGSAVSRLESAEKGERRRAQHVDAELEVDDGDPLVRGMDELRRVSVSIALIGKNPYAVVQYASRR